MDHSPFQSPELTAEELAAAETLIELGLAEDLDLAGDVTSNTLLPDAAVGTVLVVVREAGVVSGLPLIERVFAGIDSRVAVQLRAHDGARVSRGEVVAEVLGPVRSLLTGERTALNFLTHLSGIASLTRRFVDAIAGTRAVILDTRKTFPGYRRLQKYAVRCGGGVNHRMGLFDAVLIKDNHLAAWTADAGHTVAGAIRRCRTAVPAQVTVEVEVDSLAQLREALPESPDIVLLDNMSLDLLRQAVELRDRIAPRVLLEASGGVTLDTVGDIARTGVDRISSGALTHSARALDLAFDWGRSG
jgi:nicotinate-nucleotide pyrophosphorylase (carboxylating)